MSFPSNEPFKPASQIPNPYGDGSAYKPAPGFGGPYSGQPGFPEQPKKRSQGCLIAGIVGGILGALVLMCGGCIGLGFFALNAQYKETARQLSVEYRNDPMVKEHVGEVQEITYNWGASLAHEDSDRVDVYDIVGDKGKAQLVVEADDEEIYSVTLQNDKGEWDLPSDEGGEMDALEEPSHESAL
jgi:hypothetical protein